jgi:two-component sensor histidine kinase
MDAARTARQFVVSTLAAWGCATDEAVMVMSSELIINAVEHAQSTYEVRIIDKVSRVRVEVRDWSDRQPVVSDPALDATSGRGLRMVSQLAAKWGIEPAEEGKTVWFEVNCSSGTALGDGGSPVATR